MKRLGIPDSNIILMLADDAACNPRNKFPGCVYSSSRRDLDLYGDNIEVDYRGNEVTVENFLRVLTGTLLSSICAMLLEQSRLFLWSFTTQAVSTHLFRAQNGC